MSRVFKLGAIAMTPTRTYCATTKLTEQSDRKVSWSIDASFDYFSSDAPSWKIAKESIINYFQDKQLDALGISIFGNVDTKNGKFLGSCFSEWQNGINFSEIDGFDISDIFARPGLREHGATIIPLNRIAVYNDATVDAFSEHITRQKIAAIGGEEYLDQDIVYIKFDFGVGAGIIRNGSPWQGMVNPEPGHHIAAVIKSDTLIAEAINNGTLEKKGVCDQHHDAPCIMGMACLEALGRRINFSGPEHEIQERLDKISEDDSIWDWEANYIAQLCNLIRSTISPQKIILGGRVFSRSNREIRSHLLKKVRKIFKDLNGSALGQFGIDSDDQLNEYISPSKSLETMDFAKQSLIGAFELARLKVENGEIGKGERKKIFGLSITEEVEWGVAFVEDNRIIKHDGKHFKRGTLCQLPVEKTDWFNIQNLISRELVKLKKKNPDLFEGVEGVGVSTIGVVDRERRKLTGVARKGWLPAGQDGVIIDFGMMFRIGNNGDSFFDGISTENIIVQNDASARGLAEYIYGMESDGDSEIKSLLYLIVGEGVNGAIVYEGDLPKMPRHAEQGHHFPQLHALDLKYAGDDHFKDEVSGCPAHGICLEGLVSNPPIQKRFGKKIEELDFSNEADRKAIEVVTFYLAQWVVAGITFFDPERIKFGGAAFSGSNWKELIDRICENVSEMNNGYLPHYKEKESLKTLIGSAKFSSGVKVLSALALASSALSHVVPISAGEMREAEQGVIKFGLKNRKR